MQICLNWKFVTLHGCLRETMLNEAAMTCFSIHALYTVFLLTETLANITIIIVSVFTGLPNQDFSGRSTKPAHISHSKRSLSANMLDRNINIGEINHMEFREKLRSVLGLNKPAHSPDKGRANYTQSLGFHG